MIETYTKEQIEEAKLYFQGKGCYGDGGFTEEKTVKYSSILLAALEAAEKEKDERKAKALEREAEIRKECADKAVAWANIHGLLPLDGEKELRAAIEGTEREVCYNQLSEVIKWH